MMKTDSPFTLDRFEHERVHLYYLPKNAFSKLIEPKPVYLIGSRGTGKTTLLNSLNWRERLNNKNLKEVIGEDTFQDGLLGIYLKLSNSHIIKIDNWIEDRGDDFKELVTGLYVDFLWLTELFIALADITTDGYLNITPESEKRFVLQLYKQYFAFSEELEIERPNSFIEIARVIETLHKRIAKFALNGFESQDCLDFLPIETPGSFGRKIAKKVCKLCDTDSPQENQNWYIKVCFDEAEVLSSFQRILINTMIRLSESEVFFVVSYATEIDELDQTSIPNLSMGRADRQIIGLNEMSDGSFRRFSEGVSLVRINAKLDQKLKGFNLTDLLGGLRINKLLENELKKCENKEIGNYWLYKAKELRTTPFYGDVFKNDDDLPIYQAYLIEKLNIQLPSPKDSKWKFRKQESAELRKRMVASFLCLCDEINHKVPYAYDKMVLQMSDNCIRDYLLQMHYIFKKANMSIEEFISIKNLDVNIQSKALRLASEEKIILIGQSKIKSPKQVGKVVDGLAQITASLQKKAGKASLLSSEKGRFVLNTSEKRLTNRTYVLDILHQAYEGGYLKMLKGHGKDWKFQIHASLAPAYEFSYRGAQYEIRITMSDLWELTQTVDEVEHKKIVSKLLYKYNPIDPDGTSQQMNLF